MNENQQIEEKILEEVISTQSININFENVERQISCFLKKISYWLSNRDENKEPMKFVCLDFNWVDVKVFDSIENEGTLFLLRKRIENYLKVLRVIDEEKLSPEVLKNLSMYND
jgi:hypothetical protein